MTQSMGTLIALVGVFIIFRVQIQRGRLREIYMRLEKLSFPNFSRKQIDEGVKDKLKNKPKSAPLSCLRRISLYKALRCSIYFNFLSLLGKNLPAPKFRPKAFRVLARQTA